MSELGDRLRKIAEQAEEQSASGIAIIVVDGLPEAVLMATADDAREDPERLQMQLGMMIYQATNMKPAEERSN